MLKYLFWILISSNLCWWYHYCCCSSHSLRFQRSPRVFLDRLVASVARLLDSTSVRWCTTHGYLDMLGTLTPLFTLANQQLALGTLLALIYTGHGLYVRLQMSRNCFPFPPRVYKLVLSLPCGNPSSGFCYTRWCTQIPWLTTSILEFTLLWFFLYANVQLLLFLAPRTLSSHPGQLFTLWNPLPLPF